MQRVQTTQKSGPEAGWGDKPPRLGAYASRKEALIVLVQ
jgi:hypothetical protein